MAKLSILIFAIISFCMVGNGNCWVSQEMQMFDLVEELKENFYDFLGVSQNATNSEIGKAYRKLTLLYHPDKNPNPENANKFRYLVSIYEILKDEQMRERYNDVLKYGLPDWRTPSFYYRKLRRMHIAEIIALFSILATLIHYACLWGVYFEKKLDMEDYLNKVFRKQKMHDRKRGKDDAVNEITDTLNTIPKPTFKNILPFVIIMFIYASIVSIPQNMKILYSILKSEATTAIDKKFEKQRKQKAKEEERKKLEDMKKQKKERKLALSKEQVELRKNYEIAKKKAMMLPIETFMDIPTDYKEEDVKDDSIEAIGPWTDENTVVLIRALTKFPSGVKDRWIKISDMVKRPLSEVTSKIKEIQQKSREGKVPIQQRMQSSLGDGVADQLEQRNVFIPNILKSQDSSTEFEEEEEDVCVKSKAQIKKERKQLSKQTVSQVAITKPADITTETADNQNDETNVDDECNLHIRKKPRKKASYLETENAEIPDCVWTQLEQKQLEDAMRTFPNGTSNRWDRIAQKIPTKSKIQCIERIKKLSQAIQSKQITE